MSTVLRNLVDATRHSAEALDRELSEARRADFCRDVEALMQQDCDLLANIGGYVAELQGQAARGEAAFSDADARVLHGLFVDLERSFAMAASLGRAVEGWGYELEGKSRFLAAWRDVMGTVALDPDRAAESFGQIRRREYKRLGDVADELSRGSVE